MTVTAPTTTAPATLLRRFLALDAVVTAGNGLVYLLFSTQVADLLGVSATPLVVIGAFLVAYAIGVAVVAKGLLKGAVMAVIETNLVWALASVVVAVFGLMGANTVGTVWTLMQAGTVAGFAFLQQHALNKLKGR